MKYQTHGDHWDALFNSKEELFACIEQLTKDNEYLYGRETTFNDDGICIENARIFSFEKADGPISIRALVYEDHEQQVNRIITTFPVGRPLECCKPVMLRHDIDQWDNRIEANIEAETGCEDSSSINFFSTDYVANKRVIRLIDKAEYSLTAFALKCEYPGPELMELKLEGEKAINFLSKLQKEPTYKEDGEVEPVVIGMREMVSFLPMEDDFPDIVQFRSPVSNVEAFTSFGVPMYRMMITIFREEEDVNITLYARQEYFDHMPEEGEPVQGLMWLQGEMKSNPYQLLKEDDDSNSISEVTSAFFNAIGEINHNSYDDLMGLLVPLKELKCKEGYVIDGFWADKQEGSYTKLYFSASGSEWRYLPEMIDGKVTPEFDDKMYIHNHVDEELVENLPSLTEYLEGPFTEIAIWEMYLLVSAKYYLPMSNTLGDSYRALLTRKLDFAKLDDERYGQYCKDERLASGVNIIDENKAIVSCAFWSRETGLCIEKTIVIRNGNGYSFGTSRIISIA